MADIVLDVQSNPTTPAAGQAVLSVNTTSKRLVVTNDTGRAETVGPIPNQNTANQTGLASDTYIVGSSVAIPPGAPRVGTRYVFRVNLTKTAAGTAALAANVRIGTLGTTADTARLTFTFGAGTAAIDTGMLEITCHWREVGASSVLVGVAEFTHNLAATGLHSTGLGGVGVIVVTSSAFDSTVANLIMGVSINGGASFSGTIVMASAELSNA